MLSVIYVGKQEPKKGSNSRCAKRGRGREIIDPSSIRGTNTTIDTSAGALGQAAAGESTFKANSRL